MNPVKFVSKAVRTLVSLKFDFFPYVLSRLGLYSMPDERYLRCLYKNIMGRDLDLQNPKTFTEKLQWLKLYDRRPEYTSMADKYAVKKFVADRIGSEYVIPLLGVWDKFEDIDFDVLPDQFVLKCTHDSGSFIICRDKAKFDKKAARKILNTGLKKKFNWAREWVYKDIPPRIIAEKYMQHEDTLTLPVYKFFTFDGEPKIIQAIQDDKTRDESIDYFDTDWNKLDLRQNFPNSKISLPRPERLDEMLEIAAKLSSGIPHVRVDLFYINGRIYFSEFTFYSDAGLAPFIPSKWDEILGSWLELPAEKHS